jgi:CHAD domain-containing protein
MRTARPALDLMHERFAELKVKDEPSDRIQAKLQQAYVSALKKLRSVILAEKKALGEMDAVDLHDFRRSVRRLRYLRDLLLSRRGARKDALVVRLVSLQDALGEVQNRRAMRALFAGLIKSETLLGVEGRLLREEKRWLGVGRTRLRRLRLYLRRHRSLNPA